MKWQERDGKVWYGVGSGGIKKCRVKLRGKTFEGGGEVGTKNQIRESTLYH